MDHERGKIAGIMEVPIANWQLHLDELEASILQIPVPGPGEELPEDIAIEMALRVRELRISAVLTELAIQVPQETRVQRLQTLKSLFASGIVKEETIEHITSIYGTPSSEASRLSANHLHHPEIQPDLIAK